MRINFVKTLKEINKSIPVLQDVIFSITILFVVVGVLIYQVTSGAITVPTAIAEFLNGSWLTSITGFGTTLSSALSVTLSLLIVVVIIVLLRQKGGSKGDRN